MHRRHPWLQRCPSRHPVVARRSFVIAETLGLIGERNSNNFHLVLFSGRLRKISCLGRAPERLGSALLHSLRGERGRRPQVVRRRRGSTVYEKRGGATDILGRENSIACLLEVEEENAGQKMMPRGAATKIFFSLLYMISNVSSSLSLSSKLQRIVLSLSLTLNDLGISIFATRIIWHPGSFRSCRAHEASGYSV